MSQKAEGNNRHDVLGLESGLEALHQSPDFRGPVDSVADHEHSNNHLAQIYEGREEQFAAAIPYIQQGIERGERCLYIADETPRATILERLRDGDVDVDAALESGALSVLSVGETYLKDGTFDLEESIALLEEAAAEGLADFEGFRVTAEETWLLRETSATEEFMMLESRVNELFHEENCMALCQYDREQFPAEIIETVIETHTHLVVDNTISQNFYYTPPEKFFGPEDAESKVDRMIRTVRERTEAKTELEEHKEYLRRLYETTANSELTFEETVEQLLHLGCERFGLRGGALSRLPAWDGNFEVEVTAGPEMPSQPGVLSTQPEEGCFCRAAIDQDGPTAVPDTVEAGWEDDAVFQEFGFSTYFGIKVTAGNEPYGTLWFYDTSPREEPFSDDERTFLELIGQWVSNELSRREREWGQRELYEIAADTELTFEEKVDRLLDLGRERFGLNMGFFLKKRDDVFDVIKTRGTELEEGVASLSANPNHYCKQTVTVDAPVGVEDTAAFGWGDDPLYQEYNLGCYLGTRVTEGDDLFGSVCFASDSARDREFTEAEYTFLDLMGQWLSYELEHQRYERDLEETVDQLQQSNDRLKQFAYAASHDLQEPLRMVSSYVRLIESRYEDELDEDGREFIEFAVDGADRMRTMVNDLLAYSRVEQSDGEFESVDCEDVLDRVVDDLKVQIEENDAEVVAEELPTVMADGEQLEQLFRNLVSNGIKYNSDSPQVTVTAERRAGRWKFAVSDDGIGIDPEQTDRIFEVFKRLHHDDEYPGTGIGLSLCQEIVENHGGEIWVESEPGEGSTFFFTLPQRSAE